jgi:hypothetical protein
MIIVGVDPGASGAITILNTYNFQGVVSMPFAHNSLADIYLYLSEIRGGEVHHRAQKVSHLSSLRKVQYHRHTPLIPEDSMDNTMEMYLEEPGQIIINSRSKKDAKGKTNATGALLAGMTASRKLGRSVGQWEGIAIALNISCILVPPKKWQSTLNCPTRGDKNISKNLAIRCFPFLTTKTNQCIITHDIADSLLLALYGYIQYATPKYIPLSVRNNVPLNTKVITLTDTDMKGSQNGPRIPNRPIPTTTPNSRPSGPPRRSKRTPPLRPS